MSRAKLEAFGAVHPPPLLFVPCVLNMLSIAKTHCKDKCHWRRRINQNFLKLAAADSGRQVPARVGSGEALRNLHPDHIAQLTMLTTLSSFLLFSSFSRQKLCCPTSTRSYSMLGHASCYYKIR